MFQAFRNIAFTENCSPWKIAARKLPLSFCHTLTHLHTKLSYIHAGVDSNTAGKKCGKNRPDLQRNLSKTFLNQRLEMIYHDLGFWMTWWRRNWVKEVCLPLFFLEPDKEYRFILAIKENAMILKCHKKHHNIFTADKMSVLLLFFYFFHFANEKNTSANKLNGDL